MLINVLPFARCGTPASSQRIQIIPESGFMNRNSENTHAIGILPSKNHSVRAIPCSLPPPPPHSPLNIQSSNIQNYLFVLRVLASINTPQLFHKLHSIPHSHFKMTPRLYRNTAFAVQCQHWGGLGLGGNGVWWGTKDSTGRLFALYELIWICFWCWIYLPFHLKQN